MSESQHRRFPLRIAKVLWDKTSSTENRYSRPLSYPLQFSKPEFFRNTEGVLYKSFRHCETKIFRLKTLILALPPSFIHKLFHKRITCETQHRRVALRNVTELWDKTILTENRDNRTLFYPLPLSRPEIFWNTEGFLDKNFRHCETKIFRRKKLIVPPPSYSKAFSPAEYFWTTAKNGSSTKCYDTVRQKSSTEKHDTLPFYPLTLSLPENVWNTAQKGSSTNC